MYINITEQDMIPSRGVSPVSEYMILPDNALLPLCIIGEKKIFKAENIEVMAQPVQCRSIL